MSKEIQFCSPESAGIPSSRIIGFIEYLKEKRYNIHSFMMVKDGKTVAEAYYAPFRAEDKKRLYSCSKTIAALAVGRLVGEGLVKLDAPLVSYFPECSDCHPVLAAVTVEDALKMTLPLSSSPYVYGKEDNSRSNDIVIKDSWIKSFFSGVCLDPEQKNKFKYNSHASYILGALSYRLTGKGFVEYLAPVFEKIGVSDDIQCVNSPEGIPWASSGVLCTMRDFSKIGELLLNKGYMCGEQLLPRDYMEKATSPLVATEKVEGSTISGYGYGYQIWGEPYGYGMHGMLGQVAFCFPEKNFLFICNSNNPNYGDTLYEGVMKVYESIGSRQLKEGEDYADLCKLLSDLKIERSHGAAHSPIEKLVNGVCYDIMENQMGITSLKLNFGEEWGTLDYVKDGVLRQLAFGYGEYCDTTFPEASYYSMTITVSADRELRTLVTGSWPSTNELRIICDVSDTMYGTLDIRLCFDGDKIELHLSKIGEALLAEYQGDAVGRAKSNG